jgi:ABC-type glycerol-3-phosphate transport system substrate-binding protein
VELWLSTWDDPLERRLWFSLQQQLQDDLPHIRLQQEFYQRPVEDAVAISVAAGQPPDIAQIQDLHFPRWVENNLYVNLQSLASAWLDASQGGQVPKSAFNAFRYYPESQQVGVGDYYGLAWRMNPRLLFVNSELFQSNGFASLLNQDHWTLESVQGAAPRLVQTGPENRLVRAAIGFPDSWFQSMPWLWSVGGDVLDSAGKASTIASTEAARTFQVLQDWRHAQHVAQRMGELGSDTYARQFADKKLAMFLGSAHDMFQLEAEQVVWQAKTIAPMDGGNGQTLATYDGLAIITGSQQIDQAWEFLRWSLLPVPQELVLASEQALPARLEVIASSSIEPHYVKALLNGRDSLRSLPISPTFPLYSPVIAHHYHMMMNGGHAPVPETLAKLHTDLTFILDRKSLPTQWQ